MPGIIGRLAAAEGARMFGNDTSVLADHDAGGVGMNLDRPPDVTRLEIKAMNLG
jgi:hypothetical protein